MLQQPRSSLPKKEIKKLRFKVVENGLCCIDDWHRWVYNVFPDGRVVKYIYVGVSRKYVERDIENVSDSLVMKLFENIDELAQSGWREENIGYVCDGCSYELQVTYLDGHKKFHAGDIAGGTVDELIIRFLRDVFKEKESFMN